MGEYIWQDGGYITDNITDFVKILRAFNAKEGGKGMDAVYNCYMIPKFFSPYSLQGDELQMKGLNQPVEDIYNTSKPSLLDGYSPKNNKLKTFPFVALEITNNNGVSNVLKYEDFGGTQAKFKIKGVHTVGGSIKLIPVDYKSFPRSESGFENEEEGIMSGKFPTLSWSQNNYLNWISQQAVNLSQGLKSSALQVVAGATASIAGLPIGANLIGSGLGNAGSSIINYMMQKQIHELSPNTAQGNTNGADINVCSHKNGFFFYGKSIKSEYAKMIDDYFTRMGYQINETKIPNLTGRAIFNYIQIANSECVGYGSVQSKYLDVINNICRNGVTIWHNHDNVGNYSLNNNII